MTATVDGVRRKPGQPGVRLPSYLDLRLPLCS
ncbi:DUF6207 family protein [Streptomyces sp. SAS_276]